mmetsp:Transcript_85843/g.135553  ORF Transcript_85843/g.135553 Transcript_85843/m.135553 type:complete len:220 (+) Transcript_85843:50-709(+)
MGRSDSRPRSPPRRRDDSRRPPQRGGRDNGRSSRGYSPRRNRRERTPPRRDRSPPRREKTPPWKEQSRRRSPPPRSPPRKSSPPPRSRSPPPRSPPPRSPTRGGETAPPRSRSGSPVVKEQPKTAVNMGQKDGFDDVKGEVVEAKPRNDGSKQWQAELLFTMGLALGNAGRPRTMTIRGPYRQEKDKVHDDVEALLKASEDGMKAVRELATQLKRSRVS